MKTKIADLKKRVSLRAVVSKYAALEQRGGESWCKCPLHAERTASFAIKEKAGEEIFYCQGCGKGGDVIRFLEYKEHLTTAEAITKLKEIAGIQDDVEKTAPADPEWNKQYPQVAETFQSVTAEKERRTISTAEWAVREAALQVNPAALEWLEKVRGLTKQTASLLHLGFLQTAWAKALSEEDTHLRDKGWTSYPRIVDGKVVAVKYRSLVEKKFLQAPGMDPKALFNVDTITCYEPIFVTEGELDAATFEQADFRAVSIPSGSNAKLTPDMRNRLKQAACIFLAGDNDNQVGAAAMRHLAIELGANTYIIWWPGAKDANEFFLKTCNRDVNVFRQRVNELMEEARKTPVEGFTSIIKQLLDAKEGTDERNNPDRLHFWLKPIDDMNYTPPGGIAIIYSTYSSTGKSVFATQLAVHEAKRGEVVVVYTPEIRGMRYLALLAAQTLGPDLPDGLDRNAKVSYEQYVETARRLEQTYAADKGQYPEFYHPKTGVDVISYYAGYRLPYSDTDQILDFIEYTIKATGATRFVLDTMHRIIMAPENDSQTQTEAKAIKRLEQIALEYGTIFILIGQSNKESEHVKEVRKNEWGELRGTREYKDVAYGVYLLHRKAQGRPEEGDAMPDDLLETATSLILRKDRGRGPGKAIVKLQYVKKNSTFGLAALPSQEGQQRIHDDEEPD